MRTRIAPTPSGYIHVGNALNFILNAALAKSSPEGRLLLRIDDLDADRKRPEYVEDVFRALDWLGIEWDEGPTGPDDFEQNWSQHRRLHLYHAFLQQMVERQLVFPCQLSRKQLAIYQGQYPDHLKVQHLQLTDPDTSWRAHTPAGAPLPCFVVRRRDGIPAYQVASICDDVHFGVTHVFRGEDLRASTQAQQWLAQAVGYTDFASIQFLHHPLLTDAQGGKISKSAGAGSVRSLGEQEAVKTRLFTAAANWLGYPDENIQNLNDLAAFLRLHSDELSGKVY